MKKRLVRMLSVLLTVMLIFSLVSCDNSNGNDDTLSEELETEIREAYLDWIPNSSAIINQIHIKHFFCEYNGAYAVYIVGGIAYYYSVTTEIVGGVRFVYPDSNRIRVYFNGEFFTLTQAYEQKILSKRNLRKIADIYYDIYSELKDYDGGILSPGI